LGYGVGDYGINLYWQTLNLFVLFFYTDILEIPATIAGTIYAIASLWDAITDPVMGFIAQRTRTKWGSYRPYLLFGSVPFALSFLLMFYKPAAGPVFTIAIALLAHLLFRTLYTVVAIPYSSLSARMVTDSKERARLSGFRMFFAMLGGITVAFFTDKLVAFYGAGDQALGFMAAAATASLVATALLVLCFLSTTEEAVADDPAAFVRLSWHDIYISMRANWPLQLIFFGTILAGLLNTFLGKSILYFFKYNLDAEEMRGTALALMFVVGVMTMPFWVWFMNKTSKRTAFITCKSVAAFGLLVLFFNPSNDPWVIIGNIGLATLGSSGIAVAFWAMVPDTVEYGEWKTGKRNESMIFGALSFAQKASIGLGAFLVGVSLDLIGYVPNEVQSDGTLLGIRTMVALMPFIGAVGTAAIMWFYPINADFHARMVKDIKARHNP
jgi:GPH family glycoside/pentoside/hexuronide:cation symporter